MLIYKSKSAMLKLFKLSSIIVIFSLLIIMISPTTALAQPSGTGVGQGEWWFPNYIDFVDTVNDPPSNEIFGERYTHAQVSWIINSLINILAGPIAECSTKQPGPELVACMQDALSSNNSGPILALAGGIDSFRNTKPASGIDYVAQKLQKLDLVPEAYAQGYGFNQALQPIQSLWVATRNAAYALSTIAVVVLAFMVMFRAKLSPQTVITVQSALPKIVFALIAVTFSYAIAGFMVDLAFLAQGLLAGIVAAGNISSNGPVAIFNQMNNGVGAILGYGLGFIIESFAFGAGGGSGIVAKIVNAPPYLNLFFVLDTILALIVLLLLLIGLLRMFWLLIRTYVVLIFLVIGAPFILLFGILKPSGGGMASWIKNMVAQLSVFVSISALILVGHILFFGFGNGQTGIFVEIMNIINAAAQALGLGPINLINVFGINAFATEGSGVFPSGFSFSNTAAIGFFVSLGVMLSIPKLATAVRDQIQHGRAAWGFSTLGEAAGPLGAAVGFGAGAATQGITRGISTKISDVTQAPLGDAWAKVSGRFSRGSTKQASTPSRTPEQKRGAKRL